MHKTIAKLSLVAALVATSPALAKEPVYGFGRKPVQSNGVSSKRHAAHFMEDVDDYTEYWTHSFFFKNGYALFARFLITNLGPGDNKGAVQAHLITPGGKVIEFTDGRRGEDGWSYSKTRLDFKLARHRLWGDGKEFHLRLGNQRGDKVELNFTNTIGSYRPGRVLYGKSKEGFLDLTVTSPRATATGRYTSSGGSTTELEGIGYADHFYTNYAQHNQCLSWITFAGVAGDWTVNLTSWKTSRQFGRKRVSFLGIGKGDELALTGNWVRLGLSRMWRDSRSKAKYRVPRKLRFYYRDKKSGDWVRGMVKVKRRLNRYDVLKGLQPFERFVVERIAKPMQYRFFAKMTLKGKINGKRFKSKGEGLLEIIKINKR